MTAPSLTRVTAAAFATLLACCHPPPVEEPLVPLVEGHMWIYAQQPEGATLTFTVQGTVPVAGEPYTQVQAIIEDEGEVREAGHLYVRQTADGLYWRITDSEDTLFPPVFLRHPVPGGTSYTRETASYRVERGLFEWHGTSLRTIVYIITLPESDPLRIAFAPGVGMVSLENPSFLFELVDSEP